LDERRDPKRDGPLSSILVEDGEHLSADDESRMPPLDSLRNLWEREANSTEPAEHHGMGGLRRHACAPNGARLCCGA